MIRPLALVAATAVLAGGLTGCGVAGTDFHPGVAAQVDGDRISVSKVDDVASSYCDAIVTQLQGQQQVLPLRYLRGGVAGELALKAAAEQFAAEHHVGPGDSYDQKVGQLQTATSTLPEDQATAVIEIESASDYVSGVEQAVGEQQLRQQGTSQPSGTAARKAGKRAFISWLDREDVQIDPQFGVEIKGDRAVPVDTSVSFALSDQAKQGNAQTPDQTYAAGLPASHRCG
jgi:peptidyl-prolyl cis-trans isomerase SurA